MAYLTMRLVGGGLVAVAAAITVGADATEGHHADLLGCAAFENDAERLACFDELVERVQAQRSRSAIADAGPTGRGVDDRFGADTLKRAEPDAPPEVSRISARIEGLERRPHGEYVFRLSNGQVWTELSAGRRRYEEGAEVTIQRTAFGGYMLSTGQGRATRVRRVE